MESVRKLETNLISWYKQWPHLPKEITKFLSEWAWLFTLIGVVISILGVISLLSITLFGAAVLTSLGGAYGAAAGGALTLVVLVSVAFSALIIYLSAIAITPLKEKKKRGWDLLFWIVLINFAATIVNSVLSYNLFGIVWGVLGAAIGGYLLYEVRSSFLASSGHKVSKK